MAKSIRITDDLYDMASTEAALMHRSIAQQIEHWAAIARPSRRRATWVRKAKMTYPRNAFAEYDLGLP